MVITGKRIIPGNTVSRNALTARLTPDDMGVYFFNFDTETLDQWNGRAWETLAGTGLPQPSRAEQNRAAALGRMGMGGIGSAAVGGGTGTTPAPNDVHGDPFGPGGVGGNDWSLAAGSTPPGGGGQPMGNDRIVRQVLGALNIGLAGPTTGGSFTPGFGMAVNSDHIIQNLIMPAIPLGYKAWIIDGTVAIPDGAGGKVQYSIYVNGASKYTYTTLANNATWGVFLPWQNAWGGAGASIDIHMHPLVTGAHSYASTSLILVAAVV